MVELGLTREENDTVLGDARNDSQELGQATPNVHEPRRTPKPRVHRRLLLKTYGWALRHFFNLTELVTAVHDAVGGEPYPRGFGLCA